MRAEDKENCCKSTDLSNLLPASYPSQKTDNASLGGGVLLLPAFVILYFNCLFI